MRYKLLTAIILIIFIVGVVGTVIVLTAAPEDTVRIISDGEVLYTIDLSTADDTVFDIPYGEHVNTIEIKDHKISVVSADCPDQTCVRMGKLSSSAAPIVCLPHHLVIEYVDGGDVDAVTR